MKAELEMLAKFDTGYRMGSIDEAYLYLTTLVAERGVHGVVMDMEEDVSRVTGGFTVSIEVGPNCVVAKITVGMNEPHGTTIILPKYGRDSRQTAMGFMKPLKLRKVTGIG